MRVGTKEYLKISLLPVSEHKLKIELKDCNNTKIAKSTVSIV